MVRWWTPATLAAALRARGVPTSRLSVWRACVRGELDARQTSGGHWKIPDDAVRALWGDLRAPRPSLAA